MEMLLFRAFLAAFALILLQVHAQEPGFISIDCGANSNYTDSQTGLYYVSDASFVETGISSSVAPSYQSDNLEQTLRTLRSFPEGFRNCYHVKVTEDGRYLMRAYFFYGNYDDKVTAPKSFDLYLGVNLWDSVVLGDVSTPIFKEIIHVSPSNYIDVCLVNTGSGTPFISSLEFRPLRSTTYVTQSGSLIMYRRMNVQPTTNRTIRYPYDVFDRVWMPYNNLDWKQLSVDYTYDIDSSTYYKPPQIVIGSAGTPKIASDPLQLSLSTPDSTSQLYVYMHFAEIEYLSENQSRKFNISLNGGLNGTFSSEPISPCYTCATTFHFPSVFIGGHCDILITKTEDSTLPPILNAVEFYLVKDFAQSETDQVDADAIKNIKSLYKIKDWQGDPCAPQEYLWDGLDCSFNGSNPPRIISLNLSSNGLTGEIPPYISSLTMIQHLDLSNNSLTGPVPEFLSQLPFLKTLNLSGNMLTGSVPVEHIERSQNGSVSLSVEGNPDLYIPISYKKKNKFIVPVVAAVVSTSVLLTTIAILWSFKRRNQEDKWWLSVLIIVGVALLVPLFCYLCYSILRKRKAKVERILNQKKLLRDFGDNVSHPSIDGKGITHEEDQGRKNELNIFNFQTISAATNNFSTTNVLGEGGFGAVYKGILLDGQEIAVKRLSRSSNQGVEEFQNEAMLIAKLQHTNLVRLLGCSLQGEERILVYEYMPNKSLDFFIFDSDRKKLLNWKKRFNIMEGTAQGLIYLHKYSRLRVIHRDLKASNILLDDQMNPKISDFGMARIFGVNESIANTNRIVGTYGYMSPEYAMNGTVSIKTDVYSFGVLLLEIVSGKKNTGRYHTEHLNLVGYAWQLWNEGKGLELRDPTMDESCSPDEVLRCLHVGLLCVQDQATDRPTMPEVVAMLTNETPRLPTPKQPAFHINDTIEEEEVPGKKLEDCSINNVTISVMEAR